MLLRRMCGMHLTRFEVIAPLLFARKLNKQLVQCCNAALPQSSKFASLVSPRDYINGSRIVPILSSEVHGQFL
jgi:hypothetical protein